ncbi:MAG TPA: BMP family ABC transporter substrate-binding protein [Bacillales bacterium]|nr:BMP family ABC transporter substrate-binding protein [Bacillales bacterium]
MKKFAFTLVFVLIVSTLLAACGSGGNNDGGSANGGGNEDKGTEENNGGDGAAKDFTVGMVTDTGGVNDKSFNQSAWEGLQKFAEDNSLTVGKGKAVTYLESQANADYLPNLNKLVRKDYDLVFGIGYKMADAIKKVAQQNPDAKLAIVDSVVKTDSGDLVKNVASITFKEQQGSFLVGVAAGIMTDSNKVGFVGGVESAVISRFEYGFRAGVKAVNPDAQIFVQYAASFADAAKGQQIASTMYSKGADIIFAAAGATGNGVFTEAKNRSRNGDKVWVIGVDRDQYKQGLPENVTLTSMVKHVDTAVYKVSEQTMNGKFPGGKHVLLGLKENAVGPSEHKKNLSEEALAKMEDYKKKIINGKITAPGTKKEFEKYMSNLGK